MPEEQYRFRHGVTRGTVTAEQAYGELERIRTAHDDKLNPRDVVRESRPDAAVLHPFFEWDDAIAAEEHRVQQARRLSRSVYVVTPSTRDDEAPSETPVYFHVQPNHYQRGDIVVAQDDLFQQALEELQRKLSIAERAVNELKTLAAGGKNPERAAAIALAVQGFEAVRAAVAIIR